MATRQFAAISTEALPSSVHPARIRRLAVFCGSNNGDDPRFLESARHLGRSLALAKICLVYGGASVGLMGALADSALEAGGDVIGVMPRALVEKEVAHRGLPDLRVVSSMHERKSLMAELSDGFVALPGGIGTLEELFEVWTWAQLGYHAKPCAVLNVAGYYDGLLSFIDSAVSHGFTKQTQRNMLIVSDQAASLLARLETYVPPVVPQQIRRQDT